jgi:hypothetical protein
LAKEQAEWAKIWPVFVKREEARAGKERCVSFLITDGHKVHTQTSMKEFNNDRGIETITAAPTRSGKTQRKYQSRPSPTEHERASFTEVERTGCGGGLCNMLRTAAIECNLPSQFLAMKESLD